MERDLDPRLLKPESATTADPPRVYVASLSDHNDGRLHGTWIDATQEVDEVNAEVQAMLSRSPMPLAEEYAIHDYEGFGPLRLSEYESIESVVRVAQGIAEHGEAFAHWADYIGLTVDDLERFEECYQGTWPSARDYVESLVEDLGIEEALDRAELPFREYIRVNIDALTRDLQIENHFSEGPDGVHVFST